METDKKDLPPDNGQMKESAFVIRKTFSEHGNEIEEIISRKPPLIVRWGSVYFFFILLLIGLMSWFIKYPDTIEAKGVLNSINAPKGIQTKVNGKLVKLFIKENQQVSKNDIIGYIESTASQQEVMALSKMLDSISQKVNRGSTNEILEYLTVQLNNLGEVQVPYQMFSNSLIVFSNYLRNGFYMRKRRMLLRDIGYLQRLHSELIGQKKLLTKDISLSDSTFHAQQMLKDEAVISAMDYRSEKSKLIAKQMTLPQINSSIIINESQQHEKQKEIAELENQIQQQKSMFLQTLNTVKSEVEDWRKKYLLVAPVNGKVSFAAFLQENQELRAGQLICYVNPGTAGYYIETLIPQYNFGKVKTGQQVLLKFQAYPYQEFGSVRGKIEFISSIPTDSGYLAKVILPQGLVTNYERTLNYRTGLTVQAEIVTENMQLLRRVFHKLRKNVVR